LPVILGVAIITFLILLKKLYIHITSNVVYHRAAQTTEPRTFIEFTTLLLQHAFYSFTMPVQTQEARILLAIKAIQTSNRKLSRRKAAKIYTVLETTLRDRITSQPSCSNIKPNCLKLTKLEEETIV
jgi:helix-turn-helix, Psq domain